MPTIDEHTITQAVLDRHAEAPDSRLREVMNSLVRHLHEFAREVKLTEAEWDTGIRFLTEVGHTCTDKRQEFILLSDTLGLSTLVTAQNNSRPPGCTEATVFGPFHVEGAPHYEHGADVSNGASGEPAFVRGTVRDLQRRPIANADIEVWQADGEGLYDVQYADQQDHRARGRLVSCADGEFRFKSILAEPYSIPHEGPVGRMLDALGRRPWRPAHLHFMVTAAGYQRLITHIFRRGDPYLEDDAVFGVRSSLIADWVRHDAGPAPDGSISAVPFYTLQVDIVLNKA